MAHYPQSTTGLNYIRYPAGPATGSSAATGNASANVKGIYAELTSSSGFECNEIDFHIRAAGATGQARAILADLATGAAASETVIIPNVPSDSNSDSSAAAEGRLTLPLTIASGTRFAWRIQVNSTTNNTANAWLSLRAAGDTDGPTSYANYGADTSDSGATQVDPGGTADTYGGYSQVTASSGLVGQILALMITKQAAVPNQVLLWAVNIATGAAASEVVLIADTPFQYQASSTVDAGVQSRYRTFLTYIASGTRIAVNASCNSNSNPARLIDVAILLATAPSESGGGGSSGTVGYAHFG